ncbi:hypothetical protein HHL23_18950 [Chryseobacterium sp. RP-3-3]|uniref:Uncharacterized protein n=1 Tax=Chryseobacterium antibioticum TaxID=2728847 RepID=A0A7Y0AQZ4_9FLAO|nr:hypothetical protein [Chryseobacterium antibioticum]NML71858.1 hypothetical protein [Chryseobacterium antibioticum]
MRYNDFFNDIGTPGEIEIFEEDFNELTIEYSYPTILLPTEETFKDIFTEVKNFDICSVYFSIDQGESAVIKNDNNFTSSLNDINNLLSSHEEGEKINVKINIYKTSNGNQFHFYSKDCFFKYIKSFESLSLANFFSSSIFDHTSKIYILLNDFVGTLNSSKFFIAAQYQAEEEDYDYREKRISNITSNNHSSFFAKLKVLPEDFIFSGNGEIELSVLERFQRLAKILLIASIFDITDLKKESFYYKLNGYKSISESIDADNINIKNLDDFYNIYLWIYSSGNILDKIGLARNLISLHLRKDSSLELEGDVFESLKSSYKIYEKQNVKQYIEVRNKMSDQILDYGKRVASFTDNFANGFQKSALSLVTFFSSLIVTRILATPKNNSDFIVYSTLITFVFIGITLVYMIISRFELDEQETRFKKSYEDFKKRYTDLLTEEDIARILNNDEEHKSDLLYIKKKKKWYTTLWIVVLVLILVATVVYYLFGNSAPLIRDETLPLPKFV